MKLARVKNGFLEKDYDGGYRDIKVNVIFQSAIDPEIKMICEVQLILSQYLNEKKKIHKLYSIAREETYFEMIVKADANLGPQKDVKDLRFKERLNVGQEVSLSYKKANMFRCTVDSELQLLSYEGYETFGVVDLLQKREIFKREKGRGCGDHTAQWLTIFENKYLAVQLSLREITMFKVIPDKQKYTFVRDEDYSFKVAGGDINYCCFDRNCRRVVVVVNRNTLELRSVSDIKKVVRKIFLKQRVVFMPLRCMQVSADGGMCVVAGGYKQQRFYLIDLNKKKQYELWSEYLTDTLAPCFINGDTEYMFVADNDGRMEIWDVQKKKPVKVLQTDTKKIVQASASTHNILAIGSKDKTLRLYDVTNWECVMEKSFNCTGYSLDLTHDLKYVTFAGHGGDRCIVLEIE